MSSPVSPRAMTPPAHPPRAAFALTLPLLLLALGPASPRAVAAPVSLRGPHLPAQTLGDASALPRRELRRVPKGSEWVTPHNKARKAVGVRSLTWSTTVEASAKVWAQYLATVCREEYPPGSPYGVNLFYTWTTKNIAAAAVGNWVGQKKYYNYTNNTCTPPGQCLTYTQVVWNTTTTVGCAYEKCRKRAQVWAVCQYNPPGNWLGSRPY